MVATSVDDTEMRVYLCDRNYYHPILQSIRIFYSGGSEALIRDGTAQIRNQVSGIQFYGKIC